MAKANREKVGDTIIAFKGGIAPFVERELKAHYGDDWMKQAAETLRFDPGTDWDTWAYLAVMWEHWNLVFRNTLGPVERSIVQELRDVRNKWAHEKTFSSDDTYRAMDSMERLLEAVSAGDVALAINKQKMEVMRLKLSEQTRHDAKRRASVATEGSPAGGLPAWREIIEPHDDVASGNYQQAEFAADLHQVYTRRATDEYGDPVEFFRRTYLTQGLRDLLSNALKRLVQGKGDPVVALQTNFGGGKTHSMLALYHLFSGTPAGQLPNVDEVISELGIDKLPMVKRSVLVGQYLSPGEVHKMPDGTMMGGAMPGMDHGAMAGGHEMPDGTMMGGNMPGMDHGAMAAADPFYAPGSGLAPTAANGGKFLSYADLKARAPMYPDRAATREIELRLTGNMERYIWSINDVKYEDAAPIVLHYGERVRFKFVNETMMTHPMHLHGMWSILDTGSGALDPVKHTVSVAPGTTLYMETEVDAPGQWAFHCHLSYHADSGMFRKVIVEGGPKQGASLGAVKGG